MEAGDAFTLYPLTLASDTKLLTSTHTSKAFLKELAALNATHRAFTQLQNPVGVPPPPQVVDPKRTAAITKLRETGNTHYKKGLYDEAIKVYSLALQAALERPAWEPNGLVKEEVSTLLANRAQAYMAVGEWAAAGVDAESSVGMKPVGNGKAWWRRGRCLVEMGRVEEAREWVGKALEVVPEAEAGEIKALEGEVRERLGVV